MSIILRGKLMTQPQPDAIVPVINDYASGKISKKKFEQACIDALEAAGCPLTDEQESAQ